MTEPGLGTLRLSFYSIQSAKTLLKQSFESDLPTHLNPTHKKKSSRSGQMTEFARAMGVEMVLASYGMLKDLLVKTGVGNRGSVGSAVAVRSPDPC